MKKKTSTVAIVVAVIFSILLFPLILLGGLSSGLVFSAESLLSPGREEELYQTFVDHKGIDFIHELMIAEAGAEVAEFGIDPEEFFPREQIESVVYDVYHGFLRGESIQIQLTHQRELTKEYAMEEFEAGIEEALREEYGEMYDMLDESQKEQAIEEARKAYVEETDRMIDEEYSALEQELSEGINSIYELPEVQDLMATEEETGFSLTDRTELCTAIRLGGYLLLGFTVFLLVMLLLCHLFRPSGFFTAGAFTLVIGGGMVALAKVIPGAMNGFVGSELSSMETVPGEELPDFVMPMVAQLVEWCMEGIEKVGTYGLMTAVLSLLVGILLLILRKNKTEAEPVMEMQ